MSVLLVGKLGQTGRRALCRFRLAGDGVGERQRPHIQHPQADWLLNPKRLYMAHRIDLLAVFAALKPKRFIRHLYKFGVTIFIYYLYSKTHVTQLHFSERQTIDCKLFVFWGGCLEIFRPCSGPPTSALFSMSHLFRIFMAYTLSVCFIFTTATWKGREEWERGRGRLRSCDMKAKSPVSGF